MADLSVTPERVPSLPMPPPMSAGAAPRAKTTPPVEDKVELSSEAETTLSDAQLRDAILVKMMMEGKDFHTARREVLTEKAGAAATRGAALEHGASLDLELTSLQVVHVEGEVTTPTGHLEFEATRIELVRMGVSASGSAQKQDPLLIDLDGSGPRTTGSSGARLFDLQGNGTLAPTSFVQGRSAFLAMDRDGDGLIGSGKELFGDQHGAVDGYEELRKFDADGNDRIDAADPVYTDLRLLLGDQSLLSLAASGISAVSLEAYGAARTTASGDDILRSATAETTDGRLLKTYAMGLQTFDASG